MRLTASGIDLAELCAHPFALDAENPLTAAGAAAAAGTEEHGHIDETIEEEKRERDEEDAAEEVERAHIAASFGGADVEPKSETHAKWLAAWWDKERHLPWKSERGFAINPFTGHTIAAPDDASHRDYAWATRGLAVLEDEHVPVTTDAWCVTPEGVLRVVDWKTGRAANVGHPSRSGQLHTGALAISRHIGHRGPVSLEYVKVNGDRCWVETAPVTRADLLAFQGRLCTLLRATRAGLPPARGWWCKTLHCKLRGLCTATRGLVAASVPALVSAEPFRLALTASRFISDAHAAWQYAAIDAAEQLLNEGREALRERARARRIPLGGDRFYGEREETRETIIADAPKLAEALTQVLGEHAAGIVQIKRTATKKALSAAASAVAKARTAAAPDGKRVYATKVEAEARLALRAIDAIKTSTFKKVTEFKVEPPKVAVRPAEPAEQERRAS